MESHAPMMTSVRVLARSAPTLNTGPGGLKCACCTAVNPHGKGKRVMRRMVRRNEKQVIRNDIRRGYS